MYSLALQTKIASPTARKDTTHTRLSLAIMEVNTLRVTLLALVVNHLAQYIGR